MNHQTKKTDSCAILIFAKSPFLESNTKRIIASNKRNFDLWDKLNDKTLKIAQQSKISYFISDETSQVGENFGEKITHSIRTVFNKGFDKVIVIGNDCPELKVTHLRAAKSALENNDLVLGPDYKGGLYLIGISRNQFKENDFKNFSWQTTHVKQKLKDFYSDAETLTLPFLNDFDDLFSFKKATSKLFFNSKFKIDLLKLIEIVSNKFNEICYTILVVKITYKRYRGPPLVGF